MKKMLKNLIATIGVALLMTGSVFAANVAKIGEQEYATFAEALTAAKAMTGDVTVEIYEKVTLNSALSGNYSSITFVGKNTDAEIYLEVQGYITATGKTVNFQDLKLSKSAGGFITDAGFMNTAFGVYDVKAVNYTNCTFSNGAYASSGTVTFTKCIFKRSWDKYGLWAYGDVNCIVDECTFDDYRGIKMYAEGAAKTTELTVKNSDFSAVTDKPAIVLTYGESVNLKDNTYSSTGTFELDLDGAPNGVAVTSDVAPICKNDNGACGVLVDGKIYTMVAQAAEVATSGSTVTLLHNSTETVELPEGVTLNKNNFTAAGVTVAQPVAKIGDVSYATLEAAFAAATEGQTITLLQDAAPALTSQRAITKAAIVDLGGKTLTLTEDDLHFGTTTFQNGTIVVDPSVKPSTAVFWMFANQTLTFDAVKIVATGVTGTYLIGLDGDNADLNLLNGSEILVENTTALDLDIVCVNASTGNDIVIDNSKINVKNLDGRVLFRGNYAIKGDSEINLEGITKAGIRIEAGQTLSIEDTASVTITGEPRDGGIHLTDATATYTKADTATVTATVNRPAIAQIGDAKYASLAEAVATAQAGDEIVLLADVAEDVVVPAGVIFNGNGKQVGVITAAGTITFKGVTKATNFGVQYVGTTINIGEGACLEITGTSRLVVGHGCTFNITGTVADAKTADKATLTPSLIVAAGASFTGKDLTFNVKNAYVKFNGNSTSKNKSANGTFNFNIENSIWEQTGVLAFYVPTEGMDPTFNLNLKDSVLTTTSHLVFSVTKGEIVFDNSNVNVGKSNQIENRSTMTIKNGSVVNGAVATSSNAINPGTIIVENATYAVTGQFSGAAEGTGTLIIKKGANVSVGSIVDKANIQIDATGMTADEVINFTANLSKFTGTVEVVNNDKLEASVVDGKIVLALKPVAKIGDTPYTTIAAAIAAAQNGDTVVISAGEYAPININYKNITIQGTVGDNGELLTVIKGGNPAITGHSFNGTIKDIKVVDAFKVMYAEPAGNVTVDNIYVTGATYGLHLVACAQGLNWTIKNSYMDLAWANSFGVYGGDAAIVIKGNEFVSTNPYYPDYGAIPVNTFLPNITVEENVFGENTKIKLAAAFTDTSKINVSKNYHADGVENAFADDSSVEVSIRQYYTDSELQNLVELLKGAGTEADPFVIATIEDLKFFRDEVNGGNTFDNQFVKMAADIDLNNVAWDPIGSTDKPFKGTFDGDGKTISNLVVDGGANQGFFGYADNCVIKNLKLENVNVKGTDCVGAIAGQVYSVSTIDNCHVSGNIKVEGQTNVGGIAGKYYVRVTNSSVVGDGVDTSYVKGVYFASDFEGDNVGGIMGHGGESNNFAGNTVKNITISGTRKVGGIVGTTTKSTNVSGSVVENVVITTTATAEYSVSKASSMGLGGLIGHYYEKSDGGAISDNTVKGVTFSIPDGITAEAGAVVGNDRTAVGAEPTGVTVENLTVENITGATQQYLMPKVAQIGDIKYLTLADAFAAAQTGDTVTFLCDVEQTDGVLIADKKLAINLNGKTFTVSNGGSTNNRNFKINGASEVVISNGAMVAAGDYNSGAYGTVRTEGTAKVELQDLKLYNYRGNGLNVKACTGTSVTMTDVEIYAQYGGGVEVAGGTIELTDVVVQQKGMYTAPYNSMAISVNGGGAVIVQSGTYSTECLTAEEANNQGTSHGPWVAGVLNSGGTLIINGGTFSNDNFGKNDLAVHARGAILADTGAIIKIKGGTFNALKGIVDVQNKLGDASKNPTGEIKGGTFSADPTNDYIKLAEGYQSVKQPGENLWQVGKLPNAEVVNMGPTEITEYRIFNGSGLVAGPDTPINLQVALEFIAKDTPAQAAENAYGQYITDFYITINGAAEGSFKADGCYLAGNYGIFGWIMIPLDGMVIENGVVHPVITSAFAGNFEFTYENICSSVKDFKCGIYFSPEVLAANPGLSVSLDLGLSETIEKAQNAEFTSAVEKPFVYDVQDMTSAVAISGPDYFTTVTGAVAAALVTGDSVKLVVNAGLEDYLEINRDLVFNLGGKTLNAADKTLAIADSVVTITNGTLSGFSAANITLSGNAILTVTEESVAASFRDADYYVSQNANGTHSIMLKSAFRVFITMVDGEPRIGFFKDCSDSAPMYTLLGATSLENLAWKVVNYIDADDAAGASTLPLYWAKLDQAADDTKVYRFFKIGPAPAAE